MTSTSPSPASRVADRATGRSTRPVTLIQRERTVLAGVLGLAALSVIGAGMSVTGGLSPTFLDAMGPAGRLSIPWPMMLLQGLMALAASSGRRSWAMVGSGFLSLALLAGIVSGFFDGGYGDPRLTSGESLYQVAFIAAIAVVATVAGRRFVQAARAKASGTDGQG